MEKKEINPLSAAQVDTFLEAAKGDRLEAFYLLAVSTGMRLGELQALKWADIDLRERTLSVNRTLSAVNGGPVFTPPKTSKSRRQVPLSRRASAALDALPPRLDTPLLFPAPEGGLLDLDNFRRREWDPAIVAANIAKPARIYDLRSTFASNALAAGVTVFELAKIMASSVRMIERHYGALLDGAGAGISGRLDALEAQLERDAEAGES